MRRTLAVVPSLSRPECNLPNMAVSACVVYEAFVLTRVNVMLYRVIDPPTDVLLEDLRPKIKMLMQTINNIEIWLSLR